MMKMSGRLEPQWESTFKNGGTTWAVWLVKEKYHPNNGWLFIVCMWCTLPANLVVINKGLHYMTCTNNLCNQSLYGTEFWITELIRLFLTTPPSKFPLSHHTTAYSLNACRLWSNVMMKYTIKLAGYILRVYCSPSLSHTCVHLYFSSSFSIVTCVQVTGSR